MKRLLRLASCVLLLALPVSADFAGLGRDAAPGAPLVADEYSRGSNGSLVTLDNLHGPYRWVNAAAGVYPIGGPATPPVATLRRLTLAGFTITEISGRLTVSREYMVWSPAHFRWRGMPLDGALVVRQNEEGAALALASDSAPPACLALLAALPALYRGEPVERALADTAFTGHGRFSFVAAYGAETAGLHPLLFCEAHWTGAARDWVPMMPFLKWASSASESEAWQRLYGPLDSATMSIRFDPAYYSRKVSADKFGAGESVPTTRGEFIVDLSIHGRSGLPVPLFEKLAVPPFSYMRVPFVSTIQGAQLRLLSGRLTANRSALERLLPAPPSWP